MHPIRLKIREVINALEERPMSFVQWMIVVVGFSQIRGFVESLTYIHHGNLWRIENDVTDLVGFYLLAILGFSLILSWLSGVAVVRISKLAAYALPVILLPPVIDILVAWSPEGFAIRYFTFKGFGEMGLSYVTAYTHIASPDSNATPGCLSLALIMVTAGALYVWMRTLSLWRAALAFLLCHGVMFAIGAGPSFAALIQDTFNETVRPERGLRFQLKHLFMILLVFLSALWYRRASPERWTDLRRRLVSATTLHTALLAALGWGLALAPDAWDTWTRVASHLVVVWIGCAAMAAWTPADRRFVPVEEQAGLALIVLNVILGSESRLFLFPVTYILVRMIALRPPLVADRAPILGGLLWALGSITMVAWGFLIGRGRIEELSMPVVAGILVLSVLARGGARIGLGLDAVPWPGRAGARVSETRRRWIALGLLGLAFPLAGLFMPFSIGVQVALVVAGGVVMFALSRPRPRRRLALGVYVLTIGLAFSQLMHQPRTLPAKPVPESAKYDQAPDSK